MDGCIKHRWKSGRRIFVGGSTCRSENSVRLQSDRRRESNAFVLWDKMRCRSGVFSGKTRGVQLTREWAAISEFSFPRFDSKGRRGWSGRGWQRVVPPWKITYGQFALRFCGITIHALAGALGRGWSVCARAFGPILHAISRWKGAPRSTGGLFNYI